MPTPRATIVAIGNELTGGELVDTNSAYLAGELRGLGIEVVKVVLVRDTKSEIIDELKQAAKNSDLVITTGGLGPTDDDLTREAISELCGVSLELSNEALNKLEEFARRRKRKLSENNKRQAYFPHGANRFVNHIGTADAFYVQFQRAMIVSFPGVPAELFKLVATELAPFIRAHFADAPRLYFSCVRVFGLSESYIGSVVEGLQLPSTLRVAYRASIPVVTVSFYGTNQQEIERSKDLAQQALGSAFVFTTSKDEEMAGVVGRLLKDRSLTLAAAESCTGGLIGHRVVAVPGSSAYFLGAVVSYSNELKENLLGVSAKTLGAHGAVSKEVAEEMALGICKKTGADIGLSVTGIAGPDGGTAEKPVGTVWFGVSFQGNVEAVCQQLPYERNALRGYAAIRALDLVRRKLLGFPLTWESR